MFEMYHLKFEMMITICVFFLYNVFVLLCIERKNHMDKKNAPISRRCLAYAIDIILITVITNALTSLTTLEADRIRYSLTLTIFFMIYNLVTVFITKGQTIGKLITHIKVEPASLEVIIQREIIWKTFIEKINVWLIIILNFFQLLEPFVLWCNQTILGSVIYYFVTLPWIMFISFIVMVNDKNNRSLHDLYCHTIVQKKMKEHI